MCSDYRHALAVFAPEAGLPPEPLRRTYVAQQAHLPEASSGLPLLYALLASPPNEPPPTTAASTAMETGAAPVPALPPAPPAEPAMPTEPSRRARIPGPTPVVFTAS